MKKDKPRDLFPGALEMMILRTLKRQPLHGYALVQHIKRISNDLLQIEMKLLPLNAAQVEQIRPLETATDDMISQERLLAMLLKECRGRPRVSAPGRIMNWLKQLLSRRRLNHDLSEEIREHLDEKVEEL